ncbi:MAG: hypothetical protein HGB36_06370 [Chlorobiaceae bacterium]|jgi:hypothetical protein|nr:hypothetical protein [Chlorobiaceae bacterium]
MKLFPDIETKKRFMKTGLPFLLGFAWVPIIWMVVTAFLGPALFILTGSWVVTQVIIVLFACLFTYLLLTVFRRFNKRVYSERSK